MSRVCVKQRVSAHRYLNLSLEAGLKAKGGGVTRVEGGGAASKRTRNEKKNEKKRGEDSAILTLSEEYIENLHLQVNFQFSFFFS